MALSQDIEQNLKQMFISMAFLNADLLAAILLASLHWQFSSMLVSICLVIYIGGQCLPTNVI